MIAIFKGGPLDGQEVELQDSFLTIDISDTVTDAQSILTFETGTGQIDDLRRVFGNHPNVAPGPHLLINAGKEPRTRYVLGLTDKAGVGHYYVSDAKRQEESLEGADARPWDAHE